MKDKIDFTNLKAAIIDMDGVLWRGNTPLPGLARFFDFLHHRAISFILATNNASKTVDQYQAKLANFGVAIKPENVMTSSLATAAYLEELLPGRGRVYVVGQEGLRQAVRQAGFTVVADHSQPVEAVVAGIDFELTYDKLKSATLLIRRGARFVATNSDLTFPSEEGMYPGAGSILAAIEAATGVKPVSIGKPEPLMFQIAMRKMGSQPAETVMIGDRLETDILGAQRVNINTIMVTTGVDNEETISQKEIYPDLVLPGLEELVEIWQSQRKD
jgi:4-nitrophenyl phosphatase